MNRIYKLRWCARLGAMVAVSEITKARGKHGGRASKVAAAVSALVLSASAAQAAPEPPPPCGSPLSAITSDTTIDTALTFSGFYACHPTNDASLTIGPSGVLVATTGSDGAAIQVTSLATAGAIVNNGQITGSTRAIGVAGTVSGGFQNNGVITGVNSAFDATTGAYVSSFVNAATGTITGAGGFWAVHFGGATTNSITNDGYIEATVGHGLLLRNSTVTGDILNTGTIVGGLLVESSLVNGDLLNTGRISGSFGANDTTIQGQISSSGTISGSLLALYSNIGNGIVNAGRLEGTLAAINSAVNGGIHNTGEIHAADAAVQLYQSEVSGGITNSGTISSATHAIEIGRSSASISYYNYGVTLSGGITNTGQISAESGNGLTIRGSSVTGDVVNEGTIEAPAGHGIDFIPGRTGDAGTFVRDTVVGSIINHGTLSGDTGLTLVMTDVSGNFVNSGSITGAQSAAVASQSDIAQGITNSGEILGIAGDGLRITGGMSLGSSVGADLLNEGSITGVNGLVIEQGSRVDGSVVNTGAIEGTAVAGLVVDSATVTGTLDNSGNIEGTSYGVRLLSSAAVGAIANEVGGTVSGDSTALEISSGATVSGDISNRGLIISTGYSAIDINHATVTGGLHNYATGTITGGRKAVHLHGATTGSITNDGNIEALNGYGIEVDRSTVTGDIVNTGTINGIFAQGSMLNGNLLNTGTLSGFLATNYSTVQGQISSSGTVDGAILGVYSSIGNGIVNNGVLSGPLATLGSTVSGGIHNTGEIHSALSNFALLLIDSDVSGGVHNSGSIAGTTAALRVVGGNISGGITNSGSIAAGTNGIQIGNQNSIFGSSTSFAFDRSFGVTLSGGITNSGQISAAEGDGLAVIGSSITDDIVNSGTIEAPSGSGMSFIPGRTRSLSSPSVFVRNTLVGSIINNGTISGDTGLTLVMTDVFGNLMNTGVLTGAQSAAVVSEADVAQGVTNSGEILGMGGDGLRITGASHGSTLGADLLNSGSITGVNGLVIEQASLVDGSVVNSGTIAGTAAAGIVVSSSATVSGGITNAGTIAGGLRSLDLNNATDAFAIDNSGTLAGDAELGINTLNLHTEARVIGNVTGSSATVNVLGDFTSEGQFDVDTFNIGSASVFHIQHMVSVGAGGFHNEGALDVAGNTAVIHGDYSQSADALFRTSLSGESEYGRLQASGDVVLGGDTGIDVNVLGTPTLGNNVRLPDVISAGGTLEHDAITVTDNSYLFNFVADSSRDPKSVDLMVMAAATPPPLPEPPPSGWGQSVMSAALENRNRPGFGAARVFDTLIASNGGNEDMQQVISALGSLATSGQVSNALRQTLPLMTGAGAMATSNALHSMNRVIQSRIEGNRGLSSGDAPAGEEHLWIRPFGARAEQSNRNGVTGFKSHTTGLAVGLDGIAGDDWRVGGVMMYADSKVASNPGAPRQVTWVKTYELVGYASQNLDANTDINYQVDVGYNANEGSRQIDFGGLDRRARADYGSFAAHLSAGVGRVLSMSETTNLTPSARLEYLNVRTESYREQDAGALNLKVDGSTYDELVLWGDVKLTHQFNPTLKLVGNAALGYDTLNEAAQTISAFVGGGSAFTTEGIEPSPFIGRIGVGLLSTSLSNGTEWQIRYDAEARTSEYVNQTVSARWRKRF